MILTLIYCFCVRCFCCSHIVSYWRCLRTLVVQPVVKSRFFRLQGVLASCKQQCLSANTCTSTRDWYQQAWCPLVGWIELQAWCPQLNPAPCFSHGLSCRHCRSRLNPAPWAVRCHEAMLPVVCRSLGILTTMFWSDFPNICMNIARADPKRKK